MAGMSKWMGEFETSLFQQTADFSQFLMRASGQADFEAFFVFLPAFSLKPFGILHTNMPIAFKIPGEMLFRGHNVFSLNKKQGVCKMSLYL